MVWKRAVDRLAHQAVNAPKKSRKRFAGARRSGDQDVSSLDDVRPTLFLGLGGSTKLLHKPVAYQRVCPGKRLFHGSHTEILTRLI